MSIPKEPRQLMINLMYLVLTALLALNVSAEIFNAFKLVNKGLEDSNAVLDQGNSNIPGEIARLAQKKAEYKVYAERATDVRRISKEFNDKVDKIVEYLIDQSGNKDGKVDDGDYIIKEYTRTINGKTEKGEKRSYKGKKNKDITTRYLVGIPKDDTDGEADKLATEIETYSQKFMEYIDEADRETFASKIALKLDEDWKQSKDKENWAHYNFYQMPMAATLPIFTKLKNDAKATEAAVLNYLLGKVGGEDIVLDQFQVVSSPQKTYVIRGEKFETDIFLSASASESSNTGVSIKVNGSSVPVDNGVANYSVTAGSPGVKKYTAEISVTNPVTGETKTYENQFEYEVGLRSVSVAADKMNVFYIGVDNPVTVSAAGVPSHTLKVSGSGGGIKLKETGKGKYMATVTKRGEATITVSGEGLKASGFPFRVKKIPDPVARLGKSSGGAMGNGEFKAQGGVLAILDGFDFDARCGIQGFTLVYVPKRKDPVESVNGGARYNAKSKRLVKNAKPGDIYYFDKVKAKCPGDKAGRPINSMVFKIK